MYKDFFIHAGSNETRGFYIKTTFRRSILILVPRWKKLIDCKYAACDF